jgi:hypothetical protein
MALTLSKTLIATGQTVQASQITQSIDALTGAVAYDITISGSLNSVGPIKNYGNTVITTVGSTLRVGDSTAAQNTQIFGFTGTTDINLQEDIIRYNSTTHDFTGSIVGNLTGTSSYATTASFALNGGGGEAFPYNGEAQITGSLTLAGISILNLGTSSVAQQFVSFDPNTTTTRTADRGGFNGGTVPATVSDWLLIQYTDKSNTLQTGYIPIFHP